jgi:hypothetical protein
MGYLLPVFYVKMEVSDSSESLVNLYQSALRYVQVDILLLSPV